MYAPSQTPIVNFFAVDEYAGCICIILLLIVFALISMTLDCANRKKVFVVVIRDKAEVMHDIIKFSWIMPLIAYDRLCYIINLREIKPNNMLINITIVYLINFAC